MISLYRILKMEVGRCRGPSIVPITDIIGGLVFGGKVNLSNNRKLLIQYELSIV